ncbi:MAG: FAD-binding oxidoreductase [Pseudomonadota bacterium]
MSREQAFAKIRDLVGARGLVTDEGDKQAYLLDERRLYEGDAALIVKPESTEEVSQILSICNEAGIAVVPQGGNTGYCGGATPDDGENQIVLSLSRMNAIRGIDVVGHTITVDAGVILSNVQKAASESGFLFPLSMGSEGSCQIGGNLSTNAGGLAVLRYGTAKELVLGLEVVLPNGEVINGLSGLRKDNTGYDLKSLFMGAEGTLGIITGAVLKLFPAANSVETAWLAVPSVAAACELLSKARHMSGDTVSSFEYISRPSLELVLRHIEGVSDPLAGADDHFVLMELSSSASDSSLRDRMEAIIEAGMAAGLIVDGALAESGPQRQGLWRLRESIPEAEKHAGGAVKHDISVKISDIPVYVSRVDAVFREQLPVYQSVYGHIGDGNLHYNLLPPPDHQRPSDWRSQNAKAVSEIIHASASQLGGSFSAEHGVGKLKRDELQRYKDPVALSCMRQVKKALDPNGIMNPGKVL